MLVIRNIESVIITSQGCLKHVTRLFEALTISYGDGSDLKLLAQIAKVDILIIDDWGLEPLSQSQSQSQSQKNDLLEIMEDRQNSKQAIFTSQLPLEKWHDFIADPALLSP
jgi:DNA replication protein DnaC